MNKEKIIVALDVAEETGARELLSQLRGEVGAFKIGLQLFTAAGPNFVREMAKADVRIFLDLKIHDIPNTVAKAAVEAARLGVWMFDVHTTGGSEMMIRAVNEMRETCERERLTPPKVIGVTVLTSSNDENLREIGINAKTSDQVLKLACLASKCGLDGVVASPLEVKMIRQEIADEGFLIVTPGIRPSNLETSRLESAEDQKRIMTPAEAIAAGADYLVIGRPILKAKNLIAAVREIVSEMALASADPVNARILEFSKQRG